MKFAAIEALKNVFIFSSLPVEELERIATGLQTEKFKRGASVYWEGDEPAALHVLLDGKIKLVKQGRSGKETIVGLVNGGETFGELAALDGRPFESDALAMTPCRVLRIPRPEFIGLVRSRPRMAFELILDLARRLREAQEMLQQISTEQVEQRIVSLLLKFAQRLGEQRQGSIRIGLIVTRQEIADMVGTTVETTIRVLSRLTKQGLIQTRSKVIYLKDPQRLRALVGQEGGE